MPGHGVIDGKHEVQHVVLQIRRNEPRFIHQEATTANHINLRSNYQLIVFHEQEKIKPNHKHQCQIQPKGSEDTALVLSQSSNDGPKFSRPAG